MTSPRAMAAAACNIPLLVISCDRYGDLWAPFFHVFWKRWPDCPYPVYLGSNHRTFPSQRVQTLAIGPDVDWASNTRAMLNRLDTEYVILFLEDFLIEQPVDTRVVARVVAAAIEQGVGCLRLAAGLPLALAPTRPVAGVEGVGVIDPGEPYRVSAQVALWRVETLRRLLIPGFSAWDFEAIGTQLSERLPEPFWGVYAAAVAYDQCVEKGKWKPKGLEICRDAGVPIDLAARGVFSPQELQAHFDAGSPAVERYRPKELARRAFLRGSRRQGVALSVAYLRTTPFALSGWILLIGGLLGPLATRGIGFVHLQLRVLRSRLRHWQFARRARVTP